MATSWTPSLGSGELLLIGEARRAGRLVTDLLAVARLDAGLQIDRAPVSVTAIAQAEVERADCWSR